MSNDPQADLIYAILAMDSYNRGYGSGINGLAQSAGTKVGIWNITKNTDDSQVQGPAFTAGFYALAYQNAADVVISYRGTDNKGIMDSEQLGGSDPLFGYGLALGWTGFQNYNASALNEARITTQSRLAADFYRAVTGDYGASLLNAPNSPVLRMARRPRLVLPGVDRSRSPGCRSGRRVRPTGCAW